MNSSKPSQSHYDKEYYEIHYKRIADNETYYNLLSNYSRYNLFSKQGIESYQRLLDFGAGLGYVTAGLKNCNVDYFDPSIAAKRFLNEKGFHVVESIADIKSGEYDVVLSSHSLEHSLNPYEDLLLIKSFLKPTGKLMLILPLEKNPGTPSFMQDDNKHFFSWNFQNISNLLIEAGYKIVKQRIVFGPFGLGQTGNIKVAYLLGKFLKRYPSIFVLAQNS